MGIIELLGAKGAETMKRGVSDELFSNAARILLVCSLIQCPELRLNSSKTPLALRIQVSAVFGIKPTGRERAVGCFDRLLQAIYSRPARAGR